MKSRDLPPYVPPAPPQPPSCDACKTFRPDVVVPYGDGAVNCCWYCAHAIAEHFRTLEAAPTHECECLPTEILPRSFFGPTEADFEQRRDEIIARRNEA